MRLLGAFVALMFLAPLVSERALAVNCTTPVPHDQATCLNASWDNDPNPNQALMRSGGIDLASIAGSPSSTYTMTNSCSEYADMVVKIDLDADRNVVWTLDTSSARSGASTSSDVENAYCCIGNHGLCVTNQVEADAQGRIQHWNLGAGTFALTDVGTREARYNFCQANSDDIYCEVDPEGDAHLALNCGDHSCTVADCVAAWNESSASESCILEEDITYSLQPDYDDPSCSVRARCVQDDGTYDGDFVSSWTLYLPLVSTFCNDDGALGVISC